MPQGHYALLAVMDTGTGIDAEARAHLFEPYFTTRDRSARSGLGLATVYGMVKNRRIRMGIQRAGPGHEREDTCSLRRHGYAVIEASRPEDALALADTPQAVDLLLTDIVMPGVGGRALAQKVREVLG